LSTSISIPYRFPIPISLPIMPRSTAVSLANNTRSSTYYFTVRVTCLPILKFPQLSTVSLIRYSLYKLNRTGNKQHPCLTPLPVFTLLVCLWSHFILTHWSMYNLLISLLSCQSIPFPYRICINSVQLTRSNAFYQSVKHAHNSSSVSKVRSDTILSIPITSPAPLPVLYPNWFYPCTSSIFLSILRLSILATICAVCVMRLIVLWALHL
jgi:hypothetical protein